MKVTEDGAIVVALAEPTDARLLALRSLLGDRIDCVVVAKTAIDAGLRSELLAKNARAPEVVTTVEVNETDENHHTDETHDSGESTETGLMLVTDEVTETTDAPVVDEGEPVGVKFDTVVVPDEQTTTDFDELAKTLSDGLSAQLSSLRAIVVEAEATRARDAVELARLNSELATRSNELNDRTNELEARTNELNERTAELNERTAELNDRTNELNDRTNELNDRTNELSSRQAELADRNETIGSMQQKLRELADTLDQS